MITVILIAWAAWWSSWTRNICMKCWKITALERMMMEQQRKTHGAGAHRDVSVWGCSSRTDEILHGARQEHTVSDKEGSCEITVKTKEQKPLTAQRRQRNAFTYIGEEAESISVEKQVVLIGDSNVWQLGQNLVEQSRSKPQGCPGDTGLTPQGWWHLCNYWKRTYWNVWQGMLKTLISDQPVRLSGGGLW